MTRPDGSNPAEPFFRACEAVFLEHEGRPHWGKAHFLDGDQLEARHPQWSAWWAQRDAVDPNGVFLNERMATWRT